MNSDGSNLEQITYGGNNLAPHFSPDGEWIIFISYRDIGQDPRGCEIFIMNLASKDITRLTNNNYCDWQPRWRP
jgi:TolB protein